MTTLQRSRIQVLDWSHIIAEFKAIIDSNKIQGQTVTQIVENNSVADELMKFKQLLDVGVITQIEFEEQKRKILN